MLRKALPILSQKKFNWQSLSHGEQHIRPFKAYFLHKIYPKIGIN